MIQSEADAAEMFCRDARQGAYLGGTRRLTAAQRRRWRIDWRHHLLTMAQRLGERGLNAADLPTLAGAMEQLIELAVRCRERPCFPADDPVRSARIDVLGAVEALWDARARVLGMQSAVGTLTDELVRWEHETGWPTGRSTAFLGERLAARLHAPEVWERAGEGTAAALDAALARRNARPPLDGATYRDTVLGRALGHRLRVWMELLVARLSVRAPELARTLAHHPAFDPGTHERLAACLS